MANYNPYLPQVLGEEWVPIRDEEFQVPPDFDGQEDGHSFTVPAGAVRAVTDARFYVNDWPQGDSSGLTFLANVYVKGTEDQSGPIRRVIIPVNAGSVTGEAGSFNSGSLGFVASLMDPNNEDVTTHVGGAPAGSIEAYFAVNQYAPILNGKRILGVNILYGMQGGTQEEMFTGGSLTAEIGTSRTPFAGVVYGRGGLDLNNFVIDNVHINPIPHSITRMPLGEIDPYWSVALSPNGTADRMPWTYTSLQRFEATNANPHAWRYNSSANAAIISQWSLGYLAMEVIFCEEQRVAVGGRSFGPVSTRTTPFTMGLNKLPLRTLSQGAVFLNPGDYTVALSNGDVGTLITALGKTPEAPTLNAVRELYGLPTIPGIRIIKPFPADESIVDQVFTDEVSHVLPQLTVHASGGVLLESHVYGVQAVAQVYGSITATQNIMDTGIGGTFSYPQVRFYARRFGETTIPLLFQNPLLPTVQASITPAAFDALTPTDGIIDGWKEVTLRLGVPATLGGGTNPTYVWSAVGETSGNRWEVLGAVAPALSGLPGNLLNVAPAVNALSSATYGQPTFGATVELGWVPGYAPPVSGTTLDPTSDAMLLFSQDMPAISGFTLSAAMQPITGIGMDCGGAPCCVPTGITYHRITWSALTGQATSGFGSYELQRMDPLTEWQTIMLGTSVALTGFNDYEARVNLLSSYRIRANNIYSFSGPWSSTITGTLASPGVSGGPCLNSTGVLIFTSNASQSGRYNLAYVSVFEDAKPSEDFVFPEAQTLQLKRMFRRDYQTAFKPSERGGEAFSRMLLVQAAAISPPKLADVKSLRDMAWADLPYVCVRDEVGDRWLSSVQVPSDRVQRNRRLYYATVGIVEVTATPFPVNPATAP